MVQYFFSSLARMTGIFSQLIFAYFATNLLGITESGVLFVCISLLTAMSLIPRFGMDGYLPIPVSMAVYDQNYTAIRVIVKNTVLYVIISSLVVAIVLMLLMQLNFFRNELSTVVVYVLLWTPLFSINWVLTGVFKGLGQSVFSNLSESGLIYVFTLMSLLLYSIFGEVTLKVVMLSFLLGLIGSLFVSILYLIRTIDKPYLKSESQIKFKYRDAIPFFKMSLLNYVVHWSPVLVLGMLGDVKQAGMYHVVYKLAIAIVMLLAVANSITSFTYVRLWRDNNLELITVLIAKVVLGFSIILGLIMVAMMFLDNIVLAAFNIEPSLAINALWVLVIGVSLHVLFGTAINFLNMVGYSKLVFKVFFVSVFLGLITGYNYLGQGAYGIAIGVATVLVLYSLICMFISVFVILQKSKKISIRF